MSESTYEQLLAENREFRQRLQEAEDTVEAIRTGQVDAVVVSAPAEEKVYTLEGVERPYRLLIEAMQQGAATVDRAGTLLYCNRYFADLLGRPLEKVIGAALRQFCAERDVAVLEDMLRSVPVSQKVRREVALLR